MDISVLPGMLGGTLPIPVLNLNLAAILPKGTSISEQESALLIAPRLFEVIDATTLAMTISFQGSQAGDPSEVRDFTGGHDIGIGLSEASLHSDVDNLWPAIPRSITESGSVQVDNVRELLDSVRGISNLPSELNTMGTTQKRSEVEHAWVDYTATIEPQKPNIRFIDGGKIEIL